MKIKTRDGQRDIDLKGGTRSISFVVPCDQEGREVTTGAVQNKNWCARSMTMAQLDEYYFSTPREIRLSHDQYMSLQKKQRGRFKNGGAVLFADLKEGSHTKKADDIQARTAINFDIENRHDDGTALPCEAVDDIRAALESMGVSYIMHNTLSHCATAPRLRVIIPTDEPIKPDDYEKLATFLGQFIGYPDFIDEASYRINQLMYLPAVCKDVEPIHYSQVDRPFVSVKALLEYAPNLPKKQTARKDQPNDADDAEKETGVPKTAPGIIGIFNRYFGSVRKAMEQYDLPYNYQHEGQPLLYDESESGIPGVWLDPDANGDEEQYFYSFHESDPAGHQKLDAFGLVALLHYGIDQNVKDDPQHPNAERAEAKKKMFTDLMKIQQIRDEYEAQKAEKQTENQQNGNAVIDYDALTEEDLRNPDTYKAVIAMQPTEMVTAEEMLKATAKKLKISGGATLVSKMIKAVVAESKTAVTVQTTIGEAAPVIGCFSGAEEEYHYNFKYPPDFICIDKGIAYRTEIICRHPLLITKRWVDIDTNEVSYNVSWHRMGEPWKTAEYLPGSTILNARQLLPVFADKGINVTGSTAGMLADYIADLIEVNRDIPTEYTTTRMGWRSDGSFVPYADGITLNTRKSGSEAFCKSVTTAGNLETWIEAVKPYRDGKHKALEIIMAASFASVLVPFTCSLPFIVHLWNSQSGSGKTVAIMMAASVWGNPAKGKYLQTMQTTTVGLEMLAAAANNLPVIADELQTIANNGKVDLARMIYMFCEGQNKTRGAKTGGIQNKKSWENLMISNGEQPLTTIDDREGALARTINIGADGRIFDTPAAAMTMARAVQENYGHAGAEFIKALQLPDALDKIRNLYETTEDRKALAAADVVEKQINSALTIIVASKLIARVIFHDSNYLTVQDLLPYLVTNKVIDINTRAYNWLKSFAVAHVQNFVKVSPVTEAPNGYTSGGNELPHSSECWGRADFNGEDELTKLAFICPIARAQFKEAGYDYTAFSKWAIEKGISKVNPGRQDICVKIPMHGTAHCMVIDFQRIDTVEQITISQQMTTADMEHTQDALKQKLEELKRAYEVHGIKWDPATVCLLNIVSTTAFDLMGKDGKQIAAWINTNLRIGEDYESASKALQNGAYDHD